MTTGRPSSYTQEIGDEICERMSEGESLRSICSSPGFPNRASVFRWLHSNEVFRSQYARAREEQAETLADEIINIADDGLNDTYIDDDGNKRTNQDVIARSRLRVDARKWIASKLKPRVYGDKLLQELTGPGGGAIGIKIEKIITDPIANSDKTS